MWIPLNNAIVLLMTTAMIFYLIPKYKIQWQILVVLIWLCGMAWMMFTQHQTNMDKIFIPSQYLLMET